LEALPGVESVAIAATLPSWGAEQRQYQLDGSEPLDAMRRPEIRRLPISTGYFHTLKGAILAGRDFSDTDGLTAAPVTIVNQLFAAASWPGQDPIGKRLRLYDHDTAGPWITVVGVSANIIQSDVNRQKFDPVIYMPYGQTAGTGAWFMMRTQVPPSTLLAALRKEVYEMDVTVMTHGPFLMNERLERFWDSRFYGILFSIFAGIALLLASIGLYSVIAHSVSQRTQEIGVRMAIGAKEQDILRLVFRQGMMPLASGLAIGLAASFAVNRLLRSELVQVSPSDPVTLAVSAAVLIAAAMLGCWIPARRAMRVDPLVALRHE
jgi:predicted permease